MAVKRLLVSQVADRFVLAISCHQKFIKLAWELNMVFECHLKAFKEYNDCLYFLPKLKGHTYYMYSHPEVDLRCVWFVIDMIRVY